MAGAGITADSGSRISADVPHSPAAAATAHIRSPLRWATFPVLPLFRRPRNHPITDERRTPLRVNETTTESPSRSAKVPLPAGWKHIPAFSRRGEVRGGGRVRQGGGIATSPSPSRPRAGAGLPARDH
ncbi:hypothetical protein GCM10009605_61280 [Nocardiopsis composta]